MALKKNLPDLAAEARQRGVPEVDVSEVEKSMDDGSDLIVIDVREPDERAKGSIPGSINIPRGVLERDIEKKAFAGEATDADLDRPIVCYCGGGSRSLLAAEALRRMGFANAGSLRGGMGAWREGGKPIQTDAPPT